MGRVRSDKLATDRGLVERLHETRSVSDSEDSVTLPIRSDSRPRDNLLDGLDLACRLNLTIYSCGFAGSGAHLEYLFPPGVAERHRESFGKIFG